MSKLKTQPTNASVKKFIERVKDEQKREDAFKIHDMMKKVSGEDGVMWGKSIIGFGEYDYEYASGRKGTWMRIGYSPRQKNLSLYILNYGDIDVDKDLLEKLGKYKHGKSCLYINKLEDVDEKVLEKLIERAWGREMFK